jgi:hypothetical protein
MTSDRKPDRARDPRLVDPALAAAWREHAQAEPPAALDAAILAAAHRAAGAEPRDADALAEAREPERWWWPLAAAAAIGAVAFGVTQLLPSERAAVDTIVSDTPRSTPGATSRATEQQPSVPPAISSSQSQAPGADAAPDVSPIRKRAEEPRPSSDRRTKERTAPAVAATPPPAEVPAPVKREAAPTTPGPAAIAVPSEPAAAPAPLAEPRAFPAEPRAADAIEPSSREVRGNVERAIPPAAEPPREFRERADAARAPAPKGAAKLAAETPSAFAARQVADSAKADASATPHVSGAGKPAPPGVPRTVDEWIARLRALRREGRETEAQSALQEFRAAWADADTRLPPDLREWAATVKHAPAR